MSAPTDRAGLVRVMAGGSDNAGLLHVAECALADLEAAGLRVVPVEATARMRRAAMDAVRKHLAAIPEDEQEAMYGPPDERGHRLSNTEKHSVRWAAMLAASPFAPQQEKQE